MIKKSSYFKNQKEDIPAFEKWVNKLEKINGYEYDKLSIDTSLGKTKIYGFNTENNELNTLLIFPGYRTSSLIWDIEKGLGNISKELRIFLIETNGQPNLSEGNSPDIRNLDYGIWGSEIFDKLNIQSAYIAGASFGGLICMKISLVIPNKIKCAFLLNPACFRMISFGFKNLYYNLLPMLKTTDENIRKFLNKVIFHKPEHSISKESEVLLLEYLHLAISKYKDKTEKPYYMGNELNKIEVETHLIVGENDIIIPPEKSIRKAKKHLKNNLKNIQIFEGVGHGIELYYPCLTYIEKTIKAHNKT